VVGLSKLGSMSKESFSEGRKMDRSGTYGCGSDEADGFSWDTLAAHGADVAGHRGDWGVVDWLLVG